MKKSLLITVISLFFLASCNKQQLIAPEEKPLSEHITLGNPSNATQDAGNPNNYLMLKREYVVSYNRDKAHANWVAWSLTPAWIGNTPRQDDFRADNTLPAGFYPVTTSDYTNSGFDRGHLCPSADRDIDIPTNSSTFLMTNIIPQAPNNNRNAWAELETYCRSLVSQGNECYIYAGTYGTGGTGSNGGANTIAAGKINVPARTWKIVVILTQGTDDLKRVNSSTRIIAVDMPNDQTVNNDWRQYRTTTRTLETKTGYNFLSAIPQNVQDTLENMQDNL
jgi:endonuclease G, mitochondrial